jgi:hypothetical protein
MESKGGIGLAKTTMLCLLGAAAAVPPHPVSAMDSKIVYTLRITNGACSQVSKITSPSVRTAYVPKTTLGEKLFALRQKAIGRGTPLLTENQIIEEVMRRRGDLPDAKV